MDDPPAKSDIYTKLLNSFGKTDGLKEEITKSAYDDQITLIKDDLLSTVQNQQETALQVLKVLVDNNVHDVQSDVIDILSDDNIDQRLKNSIFECHSNHIKGLLRSCDATGLASLCALWQAYDAQKFVEILEEACCDNKYNQHCKNILFTKLIPEIMDMQGVGDVSKLNSINLALEIARMMPLTRLSIEEYEKFLEGVNNYIKNISDLRDNNFKYWHKLWMFIVRFLGIKLHQSMNLMNRLLRVVEHAFRNSCCEQRLRGYDCWKELIDNVSLDTNHISSDKQIRLLLTPLRAKFSRQEAIILKRFEVYVHLVEKLQGQATLVLKEFLEFCFGEVAKDTDPNKTGHGKTLPQLWIRSAKVLLAMLGHSHDKTDQCLDSDSEVQFKSPIINSTNISRVYSHVINSVAECCRLLKDVELDQRKNTVLKCFWRSLLHIILDESVSEQANITEIMSKVLDDLLKDVDPYCQSIAVLIFKESVEMDKSKALSFVLSNVDRYINIIFSVPLSKDSNNAVEHFLAIANHSDSADVKSKVTRQLFEGFLKYKTATTNTDCVADIWIFVANKLDDFTTVNSLDEFLVWPVSYVHKLTEQSKAVSIYEQLKRLVSPFVEQSDELHLSLFKQLEKALKNNPLLLTDVLNLVTMFNPKTSNKDITNITLEMLALMLLVPTTSESQGHREIIQSYIKKFYEAGVTKIHNHDTIKNLCVCVEHLLKLKHYEILESVEESLASLPDNIKCFYGKYLTLDFLLDILEKETDLKITEKIQQVMQHLRAAKDAEPKKDLTCIMPKGGRSAKIAKLVKQMPHSPNKQSLSPSTLRLFGKDIETHSPLKVIGSQLKNVKNTPKKSPASTPTRKKSEPPLIDDETNSKFVLIDSEVKLDKSKLTEHQKETLKKRREDIPALYQDLSQSVSQSLDSNSAIVAKPNQADVFKKPTEVDARHFNVFSSEIDNPTEHKEKDAEMKQTASDNDNRDLSKAEQEAKASGRGKKGKVDVVLKKLSMDIVGADDFVSTRSKRASRLQKKKSEKKSKSKKASEGKATKAKIKDDSSAKPESQPLANVAEIIQNIDCQEVPEKPEGSTKETITEKFIAEEDSKKREPDNEESEQYFTPQEVSKLESSSTLNEAVAKDKENKQETHEVEMKAEVQAENSEIPNNPKLYNEGETIINVKEEMLTKENLVVHITLPNRKRTRKSITLPVPSADVRKSRRKSLPSKKLTQSDLFTNIPSKKSKSNDKRDLKSANASKNTQKDNIISDNLTQSELFKQTDIEPLETIPANKPSETIPAKDFDGVADKVKENKSELEALAQSLEKEKEALLKKTSVTLDFCGNGFGKNKKRKRPSSSEDDDEIIESSQESSVSNVSVTKQRLSTSKKLSISEKLSSTNLEQKTENTSKSLVKTIRRITPQKCKTDTETSKHFLDPKIARDVKNWVVLEENNKNISIPSENAIKKAELPDLDKATSKSRRSKGEAVDKNETVDIENSSTKRRRGRPKMIVEKPKIIAGKPEIIAGKPKIMVETPTDRKPRGRPRKIEKNVKEEEAYNVKQSSTLVDNPKSTEATKKKRSKSPPTKKNTDTDELAEGSDAPSSSNPTTPATDRESSETAKTKRRKSPRKLANEDLVKEILEQVRKQVFPEKAQPKESKTLDISMEEKHTQSQDTQTQETELLGFDTSEIQLQLELPEKPTFTETDQEIARMDTASIPLVESEDLDLSISDKTVMENKTLTEDAAQGYSEETETVFSEPKQEEHQSKGEESQFKTETVVYSFHVKETDGRAADNEELVRQLTDRNVEVTMETDHSSPVREHSAGNSIDPKITRDVENCVALEEDNKTIPVPSENTTKRADLPEVRKSTSKDRRSSVEAIDKSEAVDIQNSSSKKNRKTTKIIVETGSTERRPRGRPKKINKAERKDADNFNESSAQADDPKSTEAIKREQSNSPLSKKNTDTDEGRDAPNSSNSTTPASNQESAEIDTKKRRKSPRKFANEDAVKEISGQVRKQVFPEKAQRTEGKALDVSTQENHSHSQDTESQETELLGFDASEIQLQLKLPEKLTLIETTKEIAIMETASIPLTESEDLKDLNVSGANKITMENKILSKDAVNEYSEETQAVFSKSKQEELQSEVAESEYNTETVVYSFHVKETYGKDADNTKLVKQLTDRNVEVTMEIDHSSPSRKRSTGNSVGTLSPFEASLPSSPVTGDTPNRTSELLINTSDISPIGSKSSSEKSSSDDEFVEERKLVPVALKFDEDADHDAHKQKSPEKADDAPQKMEDTSPEKAEKQVEIIPLGAAPTSDSKGDTDVVGVGEKSEKCTWIKQGSPATHRFFMRRKGGNNMSPSASRIKKLMSNVKPLFQNDGPDELSQEDILTFTREVPSPLAVPRSSILKRKHADYPDEGMSPCAKRKRVNFSDPCTTSKKVFLKDESGPSQCLFGAGSADDLDKEFLQVLSANNVPDTPLTESDSIETEPSLEINNPLLLREDVPIYPDLIDCEESVSVIARKLTSSMFINALLSKLYHKHIKTIGDLAKQSEIDIARLPFKTPMVTTVYNALDNYYHKSFKSKDSIENVEMCSVVNGKKEIVNESSDAVPTTKMVSEKVDITLELSKLLERAKSENIQTHTLCSLLLGASDKKQIVSWIRTHCNPEPDDMLEEKDFSRVVKHISETAGLPKILEILSESSLAHQNQVLTWIKKHFSLEPKDLVEEKDFPKVVKYVTEAVGLPRIFEILTESLESSEDESVYFDCMIKHSIEKRPLSSLIEKKPLSELQIAVWQNVENNMYSRKELLETCFLPYVSSIDLAPFFNKLTVVEIGDIIVNRLKLEDYESFTKSIIDRSKASKEIKDNVLENYTIAELTSNIMKRGSPKEIISSFTYMFLAANKESEDLVEIFRLVSDCLVGELPPSQLMELSIEFQRKIPKEFTMPFARALLTGGIEDTGDLAQVFRLVSERLVVAFPPSKLMELSIEFQQKIPIKD